VDLVQILLLFFSILSGLSLVTKIFKFRCKLPVMKVFSKSCELFKATIVRIDVVNDLYGCNMLIGWL